MLKKHCVSLYCYLYCSTVAQQAFGTVGRAGARRRLIAGLVKYGLGGAAVMYLVAPIVVYARDHQVRFTIVIICVIKPEGHAAVLRQYTFQYLPAKKVRNGFTGVFVAEAFCPAGSNMRVNRAAFFAGNN